VTAAELVMDLRTRGVRLVADGGTLRCRPKSALSESDLAALKTMKAEVLATIQQPAPARPVASLTCHSCRGRHFWISVYKVTVCAVCHPPPDPSLVAKWITTDGAAGA
jgi:hypothetical protein